jgi:hypothetical protein
VSLNGLQTAPCLRTVTLRSDTEIRTPDGSSGSRDDLRRGVDVGVLGHLADDGRAFEADIIVLLAPAQRG